MALQHKNRLTHYIRTLFAYAGARVWISLGLMVFLGLTQGVGLVMIIPFLGLIGLGTGGNGGGIAAAVGHVFEWTGIPLTLPCILGIYVGIVAAYSVVNWYHAVLNTRIIYGFIQSLRNRLYQALCRTEWLCFQRTRASDVTHVMTDDLQRVGFATQQLLQLIGSLIIAGVHIAVALIISVPMTLLTLACGGGFLLVLGPLNRQVHNAGKDLRGSMNNMYSAVSEQLGGMKVAKSFSLESFQERQFHNITSGITDQMLRFTRVNSATRMFYEIGAAVILAAFFLVAVQVARMPAANLILIVFLFVRLLPRFSMIQQCMQRITNALPSFEAALEMERRFEAMKEPPPGGPSAPIRPHGGIRFSGVSFRYDKQGSMWAVNDVDMAIPARGVTALAGPSGAGKSTMADLILGLLSPEKGAVTIDGQPLKGELLHRWRRSVGYVPQDTFLFHDTIRANLRWALPDAGDPDLWTALRSAAADGFVSRMPKGLDTVVGDRGAKLSGGERQRIALARALLRKPSLLLLDEATSSVDTESERRIHEVIHDLRTRLVLVIIAHRPSTIRRADRIVVLDGGRVVEEGQWDELIDLSGGRLRSMVGPEAFQGKRSY